MEAKRKKINWADWLLFGHFWIALAAAGLAWTTEFLLSGKGQLNILHLLIFTATLALYSWHRIFSYVRPGAQKQAPRYKLVASYSIATHVFAATASLGATLLLFSSELNISYPIVSLGLILGLGYVLPLKKNGSGLLRRSYLKPIIIAAGWTLITALLPLQQHRYNLSPFVISLILSERFLFTLSIAICFDWRDRETDQNQGLITLAMHPLKWSKKAANTALLGAFICSVLLIRNYNWNEYAANILFINIIGLILVSYLGKIKGDYKFAWLYNGLLTLPPFFIWLSICWPWWHNFNSAIAIFINLFPI